ncbi:hypothetical protein BKA61DRAFT_740198 [Leptodontidium sp. MPI-SDFR-AT-0119]|nr:hypothetical protein BKA61DRAFT_740198 [Leptodontidium sp. MPI-SDFR-AT-0119]
MSQATASDLDYWRIRLRDKEQCLFPILNDGINEKSNEIRVVEVKAPALSRLKLFWEHHELRLSTILQTAWALVLRSYTGTDDVCFGYREDSSGSIPCQLNIVRESSLQHILDTANSIFARDSTKKSLSLRHIESALELEEAGLFNTEIYFFGDASKAASSKQNGVVSGINGGETNRGADDQDHDGDELDSRIMIRVEVDFGSEFLHTKLKYRHSNLSDGQADNVGSALEMALACVLEHSHRSVADQSLFSDHHTMQVNQWNQHHLEPLDITFHEAISTRARAQPHATAIDAWDESWTFQEMENLSSRLARHLVTLGVKPGMKIPIVFEKSGWWVIALIAVLKAGGAFVPVDPSQPVLRLKEIVDDIKPMVLLSSSQCAGLLADSVETTVVVSRVSMGEIPMQTNLLIELPRVSPKSEAYVMYTSGTTGKPKGATMNHGGYLSGLHRIVEGTDLGPGSRVLQSSSYAWTPCIIETISCLWKGACLCIPSESSKQNGLTEVFNDMRITWAFLSPSIIKTIKREAVEHLETLMLAGEPVSQEVVSKWSSEKTKVWVLWAATEVANLTRPDNFTKESNVQNLGRCKAICRIVEVGNPEKQVPIGSVGEIVVHAPWIANEYLNDHERTAEKFLDRPDWLVGGESSYGSRWYRVGDLVRQNSDGTLMLAGRGDNMVKVRGQRFDMSEVERNLGADPRVRNSLPVIVKKGLCKHRLVAVVALHDFAGETCDSERFALLEGNELQVAASWVLAFQEALALRVPRFMIPSMYIMVQQLPLTITGKIDRVSLNRLVENMDIDTFESISSLGISPEPPKTQMEECLQQLWSDVLDLPSEKIGRNQSFLSLGGDSILAMLVGARCNDRNLSLSVQDILKYGTIAELAKRTTTKAKDHNRGLTVREQYDPLHKSIMEKLHQVGVPKSIDVEDAYPTSPMQQGMLLSKARLSGDYNTSTIYEVIPKSNGSLPNAETLMNAWQQVVDRHSVLRTFFVESLSQTGSFDQVVLRNWDVSKSTTIHKNVSAELEKNIVQIFSQHRPQPYIDNQPPHNFTIIETVSKRLFCRLNAEHTLVDGMSIAVIVRDIILAHDGSLHSRELHPYSTYIDMLQQVVCSIDNKYWKTYLDGMHPCLLPNLCYSLSRVPPKVESRAIAVKINTPQHLLKFCQSHEWTVSALFRTVWGLILRAYTGLDEVAFGYITSGRDLPVAGIGEIVGTFINMLVCRMDLKESSLIKEVVAKAQTDYQNSLPHQHASLAQIQHALGLYGQQLFNTSMTVLKEVPLRPGTDPSIRFEGIHEWSPNEYDIDVQCWVSSSNVKVELWYRNETVSPEHAQNIASAFGKALEAITDDPDQRIGQLDLFSEHHRSQIWGWNERYHDVVSVCLHDIISAQVASRPQELAITSWEREMTYQELEIYSNQLANHLVSLGVAPEVHVLLCFEKSALAIVAMLAVLKAGGVCVSIDPTHPIQRLQRIISDTAPICCLVSTLNSTLFNDEGLHSRVTHIVTVEQALFDSTVLAQVNSTKPCDSIGPNNAAFILFTSGSTGTPKGIVHTHSTIASSLHAHGTAMKIGTDSRTLQFSAFVFDVSITEIFMSLTRGGVLCIPSEDERMNNLESAISRMHANWAHLTPTVASLLDPDKVPTLKHLALAGEPLKKVNVTEWAPRLELVNLYGPAECALATTLRVGLVKDDRTDNIGKAVGLLVWIVDPLNADKLMPVGAVGEVLLEGPNVAREYLKDKERTLASFIENPAWLKEEKTTPPRRFYKSGDLARYNGDGSIQILGRIDTQIKLHGQRVELGEIEYQVKFNLPSHKLVNMAVVYAKSAEYPGGGLLATFLEFDEKSNEVDKNQLMLTIPQNLRGLLVRLNTHLGNTLPSYMVPAIYCPMNAMPLLTAGKIDRGKLSRIVQSLATDQVVLYSLAEFQKEKVKPRTRMQRLIQDLWAKSLAIERTSIGVDDNFFRLGADSVVAMRLAAAGRENGITITVANIFQNPKLSDLAMVAKPFSERVMHELEKRHGIQRHMVQEIYPATPLQEGLLILSNRKSETYIVQHVLSLNPNIDIGRLRKAWDYVVSQNGILRTRIVHVERTIGSLQIVLNESASWQTAYSLEEYLEQDKKRPMEYGEPLSRYAMLDESQKDGLRYFIWTAHHSIFDRYSVSSLFNEVAAAYETMATGPRQPHSSDTTTFRAFSDAIFHMDISGAESYWRDQFSDVSFSVYPKLPPGHQPMANKTLDYSISVQDMQTSTFPTSIIIRAAWALLLAQYSDTPEDVVFGMTLDGRGESASMLGIDSLIAPVFATVPVRIPIDKESTVASFLSGLQVQFEDMKQWQNFGLQNIKDASHDASKACDFQTLLAIHTPKTPRTSGTSPIHLVAIETHETPSTYLLVLECQITATGIDFKAQYDPKVTSTSQMQTMLQQLEFVVAQLVQKGSGTKSLKNVEFCSPQDVELISSWNSDLPLPLETCIHDVISSYALENPLSAAVCSWDENLTYSELDSMSSKLAHYLATYFDIGPESLVPLCFAKSAWVVVAMLAVLKAGGGYVPMDPSHPAARLQEIVNATKSSFILCSPQHEGLSWSLAERAFCVSRKTLDMCKQVVGPASNTVRPGNTCYVIFTSGSTGKPKGVNMTHTSFSTAAAAHGKRVNLNSESRVIHFSSYAFEACILEILTTLFNGGCVCIAPESERLEDIAKTMRELRVNWAFFTPSFIRTISPDQVPDLKTLILGGEVLGTDNIDVWVDRVFLVNGYGPSETCVFSVINENIRRDYTTPDMIGSAIGGACWIVDPENHSKLAPIGAVGELLIEGPTLARGYLDDPEKTNEVFIDNSELRRSTKASKGNHRNGSKTKGLSNGSATNRGDSDGNGINGSSPDVVARMYKTGDLVRYDTSGVANGTIRFVGRKDTQIKVRGQRMELGEIENHLKSNVRGIRHIAVEQIVLPGRESRYLAAFFSLDGQAPWSRPDSEALKLPTSANLKQSIVAAEKVLAEKLPSYMIPTLYIPLARIPLLPSGKTNRRELRQISLRFSQKEIEQYSLAEEKERTPNTDIEKTLAQVWSKILRLPDETIIGLDSSFFRLGGDSIGAMHMTTLARENGIYLTVSKIFQNSRLEDMAAAAIRTSDGADAKLKPFSLLAKVEDVDTALHKLYQRYRIPQGTVQDAFPTSALQEGLFLLSIKQPGSYMSQITLSLRPDVDIDHFKATWQETAKRNSILRTRLAHTGSQSIQFVVDEQIHWHHGSNLDAYLAKDKKNQMDHGGPLVRYAIITSTDGSRNFVLTTHHSLYDGWSLMLIMEDFNHLYKNGPERPPAPPYANFIKHLMSTDVEASKSFWLSQFSGKSLSSFPEPRPTAQASTETQIFQYTEIQRPVGSEITLSTVIRAAWALVVARYADTEDVFFGAISTGRNASLPYIEQMTGPLIATIPVCISIDGNETVESFLQRTQSQSTDMIPFEHTGLQTIKSFGGEAEIVCNFQNLLVIQPEGSEDMRSEIWKENVLFAKGEMVTMTYALIVECRLYRNKIRITAQYRENTIPGRQMQRMIDQFEHVLHQLNSGTSNDNTVKEVEIFSRQDKLEVLNWNKDSQLPTIDDCIHHIIERQVILRPHSPAVESWDSSFSYETLNYMATILAQHLKGLGVGPNVFVPLCFDKSAWTIVAILAVLKAGGAYLSLDPKHPKIRKDLIIRDASATVILTSAQYRDNFDMPGVTVLSVDQTLMDNLPSLPSVECCPGKSTNAAFVVFTSGSTGVPKGIVMEHGSFVSSANEHSKALHINSESRVLQFAAYTYDVSMGEILTTLMQGGCVCVPSEEQRMSNLAAAINSLKANWIFLTPTVAGFLNPREVPGLEVLVLGGEHCTNQNIETWSEHVNLINSYGPAECAIWCCRAPSLTIGANPASLGYPVGATLWITDATDPNTLAPTGCVGELLVEGPTLAREYLNDPKKTAASFIWSPKWSYDGSGKERRFYRTGDLVRYGSSGEILFVGRRDTQVKIHGQRIELGEIEQSLVKCSPPDYFPTVDVLQLADGQRDATLTAFIHMKNATSKVLEGLNRMIIRMDPAISEDLSKLRSELEQILPGYMVPTAFIPVYHLPLTAGGKVDRKALKAVGQSLTNDQILPYLLSGQDVVKAPSTEMQRRLQHLWSKALNITPESIGVDSNFLRLGGDSVAAMRLSASAREDGLLLTIRSIFTSPRLSDMAKLAENISSKSKELQTYEPFSTVTILDVPKFIENVLRPQISPDLGEIEDLLEATDYQRWTQGCGYLSTRGYNNYFVFHFKGPLDLEKLHNACYKLLNHHTILRTVFVPHRDKLFQVVMKSVIPEFEVYESESGKKPQSTVIDRDIERSVHFGDPIIRFLLVDEGRKGHKLLMRISHSLYDGISLPIIVRDLKAAYCGHEFSSSSSYGQFISAFQTSQISEAESFWRLHLEGSTMTRIVDHKGPSYRNSINRSLKRMVVAPEIRTTGITFATLVKTAWSLVLAEFTSTSDVTFGQITTGRSTPTQGIDGIVGPCMNLVPVRVKLESAATLSELLHHVQGQHLDMLPHENLGLRHIIEKCTSWPKWTRFSSILQHTNFNVGMNSLDMWGDVEMRLGNFTPDHDVSDVWIWTGPAGDNFYVDFTYSSNTLPANMAQEMLDLLCENMNKLSDSPDISLESSLTRLQARLPLPLPDQTFPPSDALSPSPELLAVVRATWSSILGDDNGALSADTTDNTPFFSLRGDLLAAAQISMDFEKQGFRVSPEEVIDNPTVLSQATLLSLRR